MVRRSLRSILLGTLVLLDAPAAVVGTPGVPDRLASKRAQKLKRHISEESQTSKDQFSGSHRVVNFVVDSMHYVGHRRAEYGDLEVGHADETRRLAMNLVVVWYFVGERAMMVLGHRVGGADKELAHGTAC